MDPRILLGEVVAGRGGVSVDIVITWGRAVIEPASNPPGHKQGLCRSRFPKATFHEAALDQRPSISRSSARHHRPSSRKSEIVTENTKPSATIPASPAFDIGCR